MMLIWRHIKLSMITSHQGFIVFQIEDDSLLMIHHFNIFITDIDND